MKILSRLFFSFFSNLVALGAAAYFVSGFEIEAGPWALTGAAILFALLNVFLRPILKLILGPVIVLTFGLAVVILNMLMLYLLDFLSSYIVISGLWPLFYATLIVALVNMVVDFSARRVYK